jgi:glycosyltransferase involved in cell wall biosynthesis
MKHKIVISINSAWNIYNFRSGLVKALIDHGYEVIALAPHDEYVGRLQELGCRYVALPMDSNGTNPARDMLLLARYYLLLRSIRPAAYLGYTIKPNTYGSIAAKALGIPVINNIAGLGAAFIRDDYLTKIVRGLYKLALKRSHRVFFQNAEDQDLFLRSGLAEKSVSTLLPGSGINVANYPCEPAPLLNGRPFRFLLIGRMLRDKGVQEFAEASALLRQRGVQAEFQLLGPIDVANANSVPVETIRAWEQTGQVTYLGRTDDVRPYIAQADCVVLPSYREGVPRSLLEAAAMARPTIATDVVGCRDAVDHELNGYLCRVRDPADLAESMARMMALTPEQRVAMGAAGRSKVETVFDEQIVVQRYQSALASISSSDVGVSRPVVDDPDLVTEQVKS